MSDRRSYESDSSDGVLAGRTGRCRTVRMTAAALARHLRTQE
ncbi:hypothetical protein ATKI12_4454 [Kitasatospora sp. Ki12]